MYDYVSSPPRYPYLVTPHDDQSQPPRLSETAQLMEDVDMDLDHGQPQENETNDKPEDIAYLVLDTNVLISSLSLVRELHRTLSTAKEDLMHLLIPSVVINELDGLAKSSAPAGVTVDGAVTLGNLATNATKWLLDVKRSSRSHTSALRTQRWAEQQRSELEKPDDKILDCCLYFRDRGQAGPREIRLWTNDRNLSLLAETNDIPTIGGAGMTLQRILRACFLDFPEDAWDQPDQDTTPLRLPTPRTDPDDHNMELDDDVLYPSPPSPPLTPPTRPSMNPLQRSVSGQLLADSLGAPISRSSNSNSSSSSTAHSETMTSPFSSRTQHTTTVPDSALTTLSAVLRPVLASIAPFRPVPTTTTNMVRSLLDAFVTVETDMKGPMTDQRSDLLRSIGALRIVLTYLEDKPKVRRPRTGEVAEALELLARLLSEAGLMPEGREELYQVATVVRSL